MAHRKVGPPPNPGDPAELVVFETAMVAGAGALAGIDPGVAAVAAAAIPFAKKMLAMGAAVWSSRGGAERRAERMRKAGGFDDIDLDEEFAEKLSDEDTFLYATIEAAMLDDEAMKAWAYGALLRAFRDDVVGQVDRARWLRFVKECFNSDLIAVVHAGQRAVKCRKFHDGKQHTARLLEELERHGFTTHEDVVWYEQCRLAAAVLKGNPHIQQQLETYGLLTDHPALSELYFSRLHGLLQAGAERAELANAHQSDEEFLALMLAARRERARVRTDIDFQAINGA